MHKLQAAELSPGPSGEWDLVLQLIPYSAAGALGDGGGWIERLKCGADFLINRRGQIQPSS